MEIPNSNVNFTWIPYYSIEIYLKFNFVVGRSENSRNPNAMPMPSPIFTGFTGRPNSKPNNTGYLCHLMSYKRLFDRLAFLSCERRPAHNSFGFLPKPLPSCEPLANPNPLKRRRYLSPPLTFFYWWGIFSFRASLSQSISCSASLSLNERPYRSRVTKGSRQSNE